jgi:hypothetical protein
MELSGVAITVQQHKPKQPTIVRRAGPLSRAPSLQPSDTALTPVRRTTTMVRRRSGGSSTSATLQDVEVHLPPVGHHTGPASSLGAQGVMNDNESLVCACGMNEPN